MNEINKKRRSKKQNVIISFIVLLVVVTIITIQVRSKPKIEIKPQILFDLPSTVIDDPLNSENILGKWKETHYPMYTPPVFPPIIYNDYITQTNCSTKLDEPAVTFNRPSKYIIINDAVIQTNCSYIITKNYVYAPKNQYIVGQIPYLPRHYNVSNMTNIPNAIIMLHPFLINYFHLFCEIMPLIYAMGPEIISKSIILHSPNKLPGIFEETFDILGIRYLALREVDTQFFIRNLYVYSPHVACLFYDIPLRSMVYEILKKLNLWDKKPVYYIYIKRSINRMISNEKQLFTKIYKVFPKEKWIFHSKAKYSLKRQAERYRQALMVFGIRGGGLTNAMWMHPGTVYFEIQNTKCDPAYFNVGRYFGLKVYELTFPNITSHKNIEVDIKAVMNMIKLAKEYLNKLEFNDRK